MNNKDNKLTSAQIENWRKVLFNMIGSYALFMPDEDVQKMRDEIQKRTGRKQPA